MSWYGIRNWLARHAPGARPARAISLGASLIVATMLLVGCGGTLPSLQPGASLPDLPSRPTAGPTQKPPAQATEEPPAGPTEKPPKATDKPTQKPPAEQTEKPAQATEKPPAEATENPAAEPTPSPTPGSGDNSGGTSPWLILLVIALGIGLVAALYALYRSRNP